MRILSFAVLLATMMPCMVAAELQAPYASIESQASSEAVQKSVLRLRLHLREAMSNVRDSELDELESKFKADAYYHMKVAGGDRNNVVPILLAGMKRRPEQAYFVAGLMMFAAQDQYTARSLAPEKRKEYYGYTLAYVQEAVDAIQTAPKPESNKKSNDDSPAAYLSMLQGSLALAALETWDLSLAKQISEERLKANSRNDGDVIHEANTILGRVALRQDDLELAKQYLLKSAKTSGSAVLKSYGPSFSLARELLEGGHKEVVLEYINLVADFWGNPKEEIPQYRMVIEETARLRSKWIREIKEGKIPTDVQWLR